MKRKSNLSAVLGRKLKGTFRWLYAKKQVPYLLVLVDVCRIANTGVSSSVFQDVHGDDYCQLMKEIF